MADKQDIGRGRRKGSRRPFPLPLALAGAALVAAALAAALGGAASWSIAFGDALLVEAGLCFALAWFAYLKKDGLRILPRRRGARSSESWKDRVPGLDEAPAPPLPMPGPEGPRGEEYERLASAEKALRRKILGGDGDGVDGGEAGGAADEGRRAEPKGGAAASFLAAGGILLVLALLFEYLIPALMR
ncbi:hypothetical protein LWX53_06340 [bacterium]|nr:hypothetical protein [bacterium]